jgi:hypothetical protein
MHFELSRPSNPKAEGEGCRPLCRPRPAVAFLLTLEKQKHETQQNWTALERSVILLVFLFFLISRLVILVTCFFFFVGFLRTVGIENLVIQLLQGCIVGKVEFRKNIFFPVRDVDRLFSCVDHGTLEVAG